MTIRAKLYAAIVLTVLGPLATTAVALHGMSQMGDELQKSGLAQFPAVIGGVVTVFNLPGIGANELTLATAGTVRVQLNTSRPIFNYNVVNINTSKTPASAGATGTLGDFCWDSSYLYLCTASNTWRRVAHATW